MISFRALSHFVFSGFGLAVQQRVLQAIWQSHTLTRVVSCQSSACSAVDHIRNRPMSSFVMWPSYAEIMFGAAGVQQAVGDAVLCMHRAISRSAFGQLF